MTSRKGVFQFGKRGNITQRFIRPFEILQKVEEVAYKQALLPQRSSIHDVFHVTMLQKYESYTL